MQHGGNLVPGCYFMSSLVYNGSARHPGNENGIEVDYCMCTSALTISLRYMVTGMTCINVYEFQLRLTQCFAYHSISTISRSAYVPKKKSYTDESCISTELILARLIFNLKTHSSQGCLNPLTCVWLPSPTNHQKHGGVPLWLKSPYWTAAASRYPDMT